jgi:hypothetical protein
MADGNGVSASTIHRWTWEVIGLLAARAPRPDRALATITRQGGEAVLLDGTLIPTRRRADAANRSNCNGKHKKHGLLFLALTDESGNLAWISPAHRGAASEITAARHDRIAARLAAAGLSALADLGFTGLDPDPGDPVIITGWKSTATRDNPAARHARPHPPAHHPLTDDHDLRPAAPTSTSTANPAHTSPADQPIQVGTAPLRARRCWRSRLSLAAIPAACMPVRCADLVAPGDILMHYECS